MNILSKFIIVISLIIAATTFTPLGAFAASPYQLILIPLATGPLGFRVNVVTGQVNRIGATQFTLTSDTTPLPIGDYHLYQDSTTGSNANWWLYRMDSQSGHTWYLNSSNTWIALGEPN